MLSSILAGLLYPLIPLVLSIVGARFQNEYFTYASVLSIIILIILRSFKLLHKTTDPFSLYCIGLSLIFQNTLVSNYLIGIDLHGEYYFSYLALKNGWDITLPFQYNSSLLLGLIIPTISKLLNIPLEVIFKVLLPLLLACVPIICYYIFKKSFNSTISFLSSIFLIIVPTFFLEIPGIGKQMVGEFCLVLAIYVLFFSKLSNVKKGVITSILGGLSIMTHYSMGLILILYILGATLILTGIKYILKQDIKISLKPIIPILLTLVLITGVYYSIVIQGRFLLILKIQGLIQVCQVCSLVNIDYSPILKTIKEEETKVIVPPQTLSQWLETEKSKVVSSLTPPGELSDKENPTTPSTNTTNLIIPSTSQKDFVFFSYFKDQEQTVRSAIGMDFLEQDNLGRIFRIVQYLTQILLILGFFVFFIRGFHKKNWAYTSLLLVGWGFLTLTVLSPGFSNLLNASRFYHMTLLLIAPCLILPFLSKYKLALIILTIYLLFTSGVVFEVLKVNNANNFSIPYSYGLSGNRMDLTAISSDNDNIIRDYLIDYKIKKIYSDHWGVTFLADKLAQEVWYLPTNCSSIPKDAYIFLRERSTKTETVCYWTGIGRRTSVSFEECGLEKELKYRSLIKECGSARLYGPRLTDN